MAAGIIVDGITNELPIEGDIQSLVFGHQLMPEALGGLYLDNKFNATLSRPTSTVFGTRNNNDLSGFRFNHITAVGDTIGTLKLQSFTPSTVTDLMLFGSTGISFVSDLDLQSNNIINSADPTTPQGLVTVSYMNTAIEAAISSGVITLTGAVTGSGTGTISTFLVPFNTSKITDFTTSVIAFRLDQFAPPGADINMNSRKIINMPGPDAASDGANKYYVDTKFAAASDITLTGAVTGINSAGTIDTTFAPIQNVSGATQTFVYDSGSTLPSFFTFNNQTTIPTNGLVSTAIRFLNATTTSGFDLMQATSQDPLGNNFRLRAFSSGGTTLNTIWSVFYDSAISDYSFLIAKQTNFTGDAFFSGVTGVQEPTLPYSAATKNYVDMAVAGAAPNVTLTGAITGTGTGTIETAFSAATIDYFNASVLAFRLNEFAGPVASVNFNNQKLTSVATPVAGTDGANKAYVDGKTTTLTGAVTGSGTGTISTFLVPFNTSKITDFTTSVIAFRLDQFAPPGADINMNSRKIINMPGPDAASDGANKLYVDTKFAAASNITLTGAVTGINSAGTINTTLNPTVSMYGALQTLQFNNLTSALALSNTITPGSSQTALTALQFSDVYNNGFQLALQTPNSGNPSPLNKPSFALSVRQGSTFTEIFDCSYSTAYTVPSGAWVMNYATSVYIDPLYNGDGTTASLYVSGGGINGAEMISIKCTGASGMDAINIELDHNDGGKKYDLRSDKYGAFSVRDATANVDRLIIDSDGLLYSSPPNICISMYNNVVITSVPPSSSVKIAGTFTLDQVRGFTYDSTNDEFTYTGKYPIKAQIINYFWRSASNTLVIKYFVNNVAANAFPITSGGYFSEKTIVDLHQNDVLKIRLFNSNTTTTINITIAYMLFSIYPIGMI